MNGFKFIKGFENRYLINEYGDIYSLLRNKMLAKSKNNSGYNTVSLIDKNGIQHKDSVHRLVAINYLPIKCADGLIVNHKNGIKTDNHYLNLEWSTYKDNSIHSRLNLLKRGKALNIWDCVEIIRLSHFGMRTNKIAELFKVSRQDISCILTGRKWKSEDFNILKEARSIYPPSIRHKRFAKDGYNKNNW